LHESNACTTFQGKKKMNSASRQSQAEETKTISITEVHKLRFKVLKPNKRIIEVANEADYGGVCVLQVKDFRSFEDAEIYAELLRLAPELLDEYMSNAKTLEEVVDRLIKRVATMKKNGTKQVKSTK